MNEFAHHGANEEFGRLAGSGQAFAKAFPPIGSIERDHGRHVKRLAQESMSNLGHARLAFDATAGLMLRRIESGKGRCLAGIGKAPGMHAERQQHRDGAPITVT